MASLAQNAVDRSASALGLGFNQWTRSDLSLILNYYRVRLATEDSKNTLIDKLNRLALERGLTREDRLALVNAHKAGRSLPPRKSRVRASTALPTVRRISSVENDGSDIDTSDGDDTEELLTLSEEERDLQEYTNTITWPGSSATRHGNRLLTRNRSLTERRSPTVNGNALVWRSTLVFINRAGIASRSRSSHLTRSHRISAASATLPRREALISESNEAKEYECLICYDSFNPAETPVRQPTSSCEHEVNICKSCLSASISSQLETRMWTRISCPAMACDKLLDYNDVQEFAEPETFAR